MNAEDHEKQFELTKYKLIDWDLPQEDFEKELSNLIYNVQLYERKGGTKDLW